MIGRIPHPLLSQVFPPIQVVDTFDFIYTPLWKDKFFLQQKYLDERLSTDEIAALTFSAKSTILKHLKLYDIPLRETGVTLKKRNIAYGLRLKDLQTVAFKREQHAIDRMVELRVKGFTFERITSLGEAVIAILNVFSWEGNRAFDIAVICSTDKPNKLLNMLASALRQMVNR